MDLSSNRHRRRRPTLAGLLSAAPAKLDVVLPYFVRVIEAIEDAHAVKRQHQSLDPETIHLNAEAKAEVKSYSAHGIGDTAALGSAKYSAPDCFHDEIAANGCCARDSYSLGFIFYEILLGTKLFRSQFADAEKRGALGWLTWHSDPAKQVLPISDLISGFPPMLSTMVNGMLEKDPAKRNSDLRRIVGTLANALEVTQVYVGQPAAEAIADEPSTSLRPSVMGANTASVIRIVGAFREMWKRLVSGVGRIKPRHLITLVVLEVILLAALIAS